MQDSNKKVKIPWSKVDQLLAADCEGTEIAGYLGISAKTLYRRTKEEKGVPFRHYMQSKKAKGDADLKLALYQKAKKDTSVGIFLAKARLKMSDKAADAPTQVVAVLEGFESLKNRQPQDDQDIDGLFD